METIRVEADPNDPQSADKPALEIVNGRRAWERDEHGLVQSEELSKSKVAHGGGLATGFRRHFDGTLIREFFADLALEDLGAGEIAGRPCIRIRAVPRLGGQIWPHWLPSDANEYLFHADVERPVLLAISGLVAGVVAESYEVEQVAFDEPLDPDLFNYTPSDAEEVRPATPISEHLALDLAAARVPFAVLVPNLEPRSRWTPTMAMYHAARPGRWHEHLTLDFHEDMDTRLWITESGQPDEDHNETLLWETIDVGGRQMKLSDPEGDVGMSVLDFVQDGTYVSICSDLSRQQLFELAASFVRLGDS